MRTNETTYLRAIKQARKLQPETKQINNSLFFSVASTSMLDGWHNVTLGPNRFNVMLDAKCDCGTRWCCCHKAAAFLRYLVNLEERLWKGCDFITGQEEKQEPTDESYALWADLLDRYERGCDLLKAIELNYDISQLTDRFKEWLFGGNSITLLLTA